MSLSVAHRFPTIDRAKHRGKCKVVNNPKYLQLVNVVCNHVELMHGEYLPWSKRKVVLARAWAAGGSPGTENVYAPLLLKLPPNKGPTETKEHINNWPVSLVSVNSKPIKVRGGAIPSRMLYCIYFLRTVCLLVDFL